MFATPKNRPVGSAGAAPVRIPGAWAGALLAPAWGEFAQRLRTLPGLAGQTLWTWLVEGKPLTQAVERLGAALPTGVLDNEAIHDRIERLFSQPGRSNHFRDLRAQLTLVATDLDTGEAAPFGRPGWDHVPISRAIQASAALPGLFPPVAIDGRHYVDGALKKTLHATVALDEGVDLLLCINPLVPFHATPDATHGGRIPALVEGGLPAVMSQTFRSMIHSRLALGFKHYERAYPHTDIVLIEPDQRDAELFLANTFSYRQRREMAEHAFQQTRALLRLRAGRLAPQLARHGVALDEMAAGDSVGGRGRHGELRVKERWEGDGCLSDARYLSRPSDRLGNSESMISAITSCEGRVSTPRTVFV